MISKSVLLCIWPTDWLNSGKVNRVDITRVGQVSGQLYSQTFKSQTCAHLHLRHDNLCNKMQFHHFIIVHHNGTG